MLTRLARPSRLVAIAAAIFAATLAIIDAFVEHIEKRRGTPIRDSARRRHNRLGKTTGKTEGIPNLDHRGMGRGGEGGH